jgi:hypothetical protein
MELLVLDAYPALVWGRRAETQILMLRKTSRVTCDNNSDEEYSRAEYAYAEIDRQLKAGLSIRNALAWSRRPGRHRLREPILIGARLHVAGLSGASRYNSVFAREFFDE